MKLSTRTTAAWAVTAFAVACLIALFITETLHTGRPWVIPLIQMIALLLPLPGLLKRRHRSAIWLCFILMIFFAGYTAVIDIPGIIMTFTGFISAMLAARWQQQENRLTENSPP